MSITVDSPSLEVILAAGRKRRPTLPITLDLLSQHVHAHDVAVQKITEGADFCLAVTATSRNATGVELFTDQILMPTLQRLPKAQLSDTELDELRQLLLARLIFAEPPRLAQYRGRGPLSAWVRVVASRELVSLRHRDKLVNASPLESVASQLVRSADQELGHARSSWGETLQVALEEALQALDPNDKLLLQLHFEQDLGIDALAAILRVHRATAARRLIHARTQIFDYVRTRLGVKGKPVSTTDMRSLARQLQGDLHLTLERVLARSADT